MQTDANEYSSDEIFSKFIKKAKKKLNKQEVTPIVQEEKKAPEISYSFVKSDKKKRKKELEEKVADLIKNHPHTDNPIQFLIDHSIYDRLGEESKQRYILMLSAEYQEILNNTAENC